jgi:hypothetical protein
MLQRIQTVYLLLAFACTSAIMFFPIFEVSSIYQGVESNVDFDVYGLNTPGSTEGYFPLYIGFVILALLTFLGILLYKNRKKQILVVRISLILHILTALSFLLFALFGKPVLIDKLSDTGVENIQVSFKYGIGYYLMFVAIPFLMLAIRGIRADEKLVKSLDRIR